MIDNTNSEKEKQLARRRELALIIAKLRSNDNYAAATASVNLPSLSAEFFKRVKEKSERVSNEATKQP